MEFKSTKQTDKKLNELADFLESKINILDNFKNDYKENSIEYFYCECCEDYIHGDKLDWLNNQAI